MLWERYIRATLALASDGRYVMKVHAFLARHRTAGVALCSTAASIFFGMFLLGGEAAVSYLLAFVLSTVLLLFFSESPARYERVALLQTVLPVIHHGLQLGTEERVTIHRVVSKRREVYEQLTNYYPTNVGQGRTFRFSQGIVGQVLKNNEPVSWSIPADTTFEQAMKSRWSYTKDELSRLSQDRRSFFAFPLRNAKGEAIAALFVDSRDPNFFSPEREARTRDQVDKWFRPILELLLTERSI